MISGPEKILLVTERPLLALNFRELLDSAGWNSGHVVLRREELAGSLTPDTAALVVIDSEAGLAWEALSGVCRLMPRSRFVVWCGRATPRLVQAAMEAGVHGLLSIRLAYPEAARALVQIWGGERQFRFDGELQSRMPAEPSLTPREQQVIALVMDGRRNREIAELLQTTEGSVKVHMNRIFWKTGAKNRHELAQVGHSIMRRGHVRAPEPPVAPPVDPFDATWMFTGGELGSSSTGEASYDSIERQ